MNPAQPVVTKLRVTRLFNLGHYEHEKIEVTVEAVGLLHIDQGHIPTFIENPADVLAEVRMILEQCERTEKSCDAENGERIETGELKLEPDGHVPKYGDGFIGKEEHDSCLAALEQWRRKETERQLYLRRLNDLGRVSTTYKDVEGRAP